MRTWLSFVVLPPMVLGAASLATPATGHAADSCTPARALLILDRSSSMTELLGAQSKWSIAKGAVTDVATQFDGRIDLGLMTFPNPYECAPGQLDVAPGPGRRDAIVGALGAAPPPQGNWTPMAQTLEVAAGLPALGDATRARYVVLVTDGWQYCYPYDPATRFDPVAAVVGLQARGVRTFVVGFGGAVDALALNHMAVAGGTARPGCDATSEAADAATPCYYRAESATELRATLMTIALAVSAESCDGVDNDCDGQIDEDLVRDCSAACGSGTETCSAGSWSACTAPTGGPEVCDGLDNDCDGTADPGCACIAGDTRPCGLDVGACTPGAQTCGATGMWGDCTGAGLPADELCNGLDDDCDGVVDGVAGDDVGPGALCPPGQACLSGGCIDLLDPDLPPTDPLDTDGVDLSGGCACRSAGGAGTGAGQALGGLAIVALVLAWARRRRAVKGLARG